MYMYMYMCTYVYIYICTYVGHGYIVSATKVPFIRIRYSIHGFHYWYILLTHRTV